MIIGIDVGVSGGIALLNEDGSVRSVHDMPVIEVGKTRKRNQINAAALAKLLAQYNHTIPAVVIERVSARPGEGVSSSFGFGTSYGICLGVCAALNLYTEQVTPQVWKRHQGLLGQDKEASRARAQVLYPLADLSLKKHHGRAEALLIADWYRWQTRSGAIPRQAQPSQPDSEG